MMALLLGVDYIALTHFEYSRKNTWTTGVTICQFINYSNYC